MINYLYAGQKFRFARHHLPNLVYETNWLDGVLVCDPRRVRSASRSEGTVTIGSGPAKGSTIETRVPAEFVDDVWLVEEVTLEGGGTGHGPHDVYPDGNRVRAVSLHMLEVSFYQNGCFNGIVLPASIELQNADRYPDVAKKWAMLQVDT